MGASSVATRNGFQGINSGNVAPWVMAVLGIAAFVWGQINPKADISQVEMRLQDQIKALETRSQAPGNILKTDIDELKRSIEGKLGEKEHAEYKVRKDRDTERTDDFLKMLAGTKENKDEHVKDMVQATERMNALRDQINETNKMFTGSYNVGKQLDNLQGAVNELQRQLYAKPPILTAPSISVKPQP
jgi:G3E family GTPase